MRRVGESLWGQAIGSFYSPQGLKDRLKAGSSPDNCIGIKTSDDMILYPLRQFVTDEETGDIEVAPDVARVWKGVLAPAIEAGIIDEWTVAATFFRQSETFGGLSMAEVLANGDNPELVKLVTTHIDQSVAAWSQ